MDDPAVWRAEAGGKRDVLEERLITLALQLLGLNTDVVLDFGGWGRDERRALRWLAEQRAAPFHLVYLPVERDKQPQRIQQRYQDGLRDTFPMSVVEIDSWRRSAGSGSRLTHRPERRHLEGDAAG